MKAAHARGIGPACGQGRCARARVGVGGARAPPKSILASLPRRAVEELEDVVGPRVWGGGFGPHPEDHCTWPRTGAAGAAAPAPAPARARNGRQAHLGQGSAKALERAQGPTHSYLREGCLPGLLAPLLCPRSAHPARPG